MLLVGLGMIIGAAGLYIFVSEKGHREALEAVRKEEQQKGRQLAQEAKQQAWDSFQNQLAIHAQYWRTRLQQGVDSVVRVKHQLEDSLSQIIQQDGQQFKALYKRDHIQQDSIWRLNQRIFNFEKREKKQAKAGQKSRRKSAKPLASMVRLPQYFAKIKVNKQRQHCWQMRFGFSALGLPIFGVLYLCGFRMMAPRNRRTRIRGLRKRC